MGRLVQLRTVVFAFVVSVFLCVMISTVLPAETMYRQLGLDPSDYRALASPAAQLHDTYLELARNGELRALHLEVAAGIVVFPSFHSTAGILFLAALWSVPLLRWPGALLNP